MFCRTWQTTLLHVPQTIIQHQPTYNRSVKRESYKQVSAQIEALIEGVSNRTGALANVAAALKEAFGHYFWVGFYIVNGNHLELGPFQGPVACYTIPRGKGVCGMAWDLGRTIVVPDVSKFPDHITCSSQSRSEIVTPVFRGREVVAVIDVDSAEIEAFDTDDMLGLEQVARIVARLFREPIKRYKKA